MRPALLAPALAALLLAACARPLPPPPSPEAAAGGPLALVETGDRVRLSVRDRRLDLLVEDAELARRRAAWAPPPVPRRGWDKLMREQVLQAPEGADLRVLRPDGR